jgi:hypothetical protein
LLDILRSVSTLPHDSRVTPLQPGQPRVVGLGPWNFRPDSLWRDIDSGWLPAPSFRVNGYRRPGRRVLSSTCFYAPESTLEYLLFCRSSSQCFAHLITLSIMQYSYPWRNTNAAEISSHPLPAATPSAPPTGRGLPEP